MITWSDPEGFAVDWAALEAFENGLAPRAPERSALPCRILGYGEISTVFALDAEGLRGLAFKRMAIFRGRAEFDRYFTAYEDYNRRLPEACGVALPPRGHAAFDNARGRLIFYIIQGMIPDEAFGHRALRALPEPGRRVLLRAILRQLLRVWDHNRRQPDCLVGIDGQLSNWALRDAAAREGGDEPPEAGAEPRLWYVDTSTPLLRLGGQEQLDPELFLRTAPPGLRAILRVFFAKDVINRYYDLRRVMVDLLANLHKEQMPELIPPLLAEANDVVRGEAAAFGLKPIAAHEVEDYYREDRLIWTLYLAMRRLDCAIQTRLLRREYPYILPGPIRR